MNVFGGTREGAGRENEKGRKGISTQVDVYARAIPYSYPPRYMQAPSGYPPAGNIDEF